MNAVNGLEAKAVSEHAANSKLKGCKRVLVADDNLAFRSLIAIILKKDGYEVDLAADGWEAWEAMEDRNYDLLITDHEMPRLTGLELVKHLRSADVQMPVILVSGSLTEQALGDESREFAAILSKPFEIQSFLMSVKRALQAAGPSNG